MLRVPKRRNQAPGRCLVCHVRVDPTGERWNVIAELTLVVKDDGHQMVTRSLRTTLDS